MIKVLVSKQNIRSFIEIDPVLCKDGLALQKCDNNLYALIHVQSGYTLNMRSMRATQAQEWFHMACSTVNWQVPVETIRKDPKVIQALQFGKDLEEKFFAPEEQVEAVAQVTLPGFEVAV